MIGKVTRGSDVGGLLRYLFGPGRHNEHVDPHIVAGWPEDLLGPIEHAADGRHDTRALAADLRMPVQLAQRSDTRSVWHCSLRLAPEDPRLSDEQWADVAADVMRRTGLDRGDGEGVGWVAVRHAEDHIHITATLVRPDLRPAEPRNDYYRVAEACHAAETRYGLRSTAPSDRTAGRQPTRAEVEKADRAGLGEPARVTLRREVRAAAAVTGDPEAFVAELRDRGLLVRVRHSQLDEDEITGYAVALPEDRVGDSASVWFGGSKLASELSWTRLRSRWNDTVLTECRPTGWTALTTELERLDLTAEGADETLSIAAAAAVDRGRIARSPRREVDDQIARACRRSWGASHSLSAAHHRVLRASRALPRSRASDPDALRTMLTIARLLDDLARLRRAQNRAAQATAALQAATTVRRLHPPHLTGPSAFRRVPAPGRPRPTARSR